MRRIFSVVRYLLPVLAWTSAHAADTPVKLQFNWSFNGSQAPFALALDKKYFEREGLAVSVDRGTGSADTIAKLAAGTYDFATADVNLLVKFNHDHPQSRLTSVFLVYDSAANAVVSFKSSGISAPADLKGKTVAAPAGDSGRALFPLFAQAAGIAPDILEWQSVAPQLRDTLLFQRKVDAVVSEAPTTILALGAMGVNRDQLAVIPFTDYLPELLGIGVMTTQKTIQEKPELVRAFVRAIALAERDAIKDPAAAMPTMLRLDPLMDLKVETERFKAALEFSMRNPLLKTAGLGAVDAARLKKAIDLTAQLSGVPAPADPSEIYTQAFLPPASDRMY